MSDTISWYYRRKNTRESACNTCGVKCKHAKESARRFLSCPDPKKVESYLKDTTGVDICLQDGDLICYRFCTSMLKSDVCMLSSGDIVSELETKHTKLVEEFVCVTPDCHVQLALCKTALSVSGFPISLCV